jgi:hypothetical protein
MAQRPPCWWSQPESELCKWGRKSEADIIGKLTWSRPLLVPGARPLSYKASRCARIIATMKASKARSHMDPQADRSIWLNPRTYKQLSKAKSLIRCGLVMSVCFETRWFCRFTPMWLIWRPFDLYRYLHWSTTIHTILITVLNDKLLCHSISERFHF